MTFQAIIWPLTASTPGMSSVTTSSNSSGTGSRLNLSPSCMEARTLKSTSPIMSTDNSSKELRSLSVSTKDVDMKATPRTTAKVVRA